MFGIWVRNQVSPGIDLSDIQVSLNILIIFPFLVHKTPGNIMSGPLEKAEKKLTL